ncbi:glycoside hydrolase family 2 protein [Flavobacterium sp. W22_SRS_FK3]|uniref:glycoside hydrolase family 2 protein n=1 Tax=Flavobacterium sp. W22_SRS_FK3 TaxID=3240275 RepID=UPI003F8DE6A1
MKKQNNLHTTRSILLLLLFIFLNSVKIWAQIQTEIRTKTNINGQWLYTEDNTTSAEQVNKSSHWSEINLPHSWNSEDVTDLEPGYRRGASWYKKNIQIEDLKSTSNYYLYFEGANITTTVYINNKKAGTHTGGYIGFKIDATPFLKTGANEVLIRVDNSYNIEIIPSQKSDFYIYGGLTRDVWLLEMNKTHISNLKVNTPKVTAKNASVTLDFTINNWDKIANARIKTVIKNPKGKIVATKSVPLLGGTASIAFENIKNPDLWDTDHPNLYTLESSITTNKTTIDIFDDKVGLRWFEFKDHGPFYLNGKRLLIRGTHRHEEHAGVGAAMSNKQHRADMESIKKMGANFVRLAHYPQDPEIYKACDELGLLVWDELPWCRGGIGNETWQTNTKNMLREMITQNYNHPSIIIWSLGNEMNWLPDFPDGGNTKRTNDFLKELNTIAHQLDPNRKTAIRKYYEGSEIVDVFSPSIWSGWYSGSYKNYQKAIDVYKKQYKHFIHAEYGGDSHMGRHTENPVTGEGVITADGWEEAIVQTKAANIAQIGDWSENYIVDLFDWHLHIAENDPDFIGNIQWAFKDFATPLRPEDDIPYMNQKGIMDRNGNPKDAYYVFKSYWSKEPFAYIESHTWTERQGEKGNPRNVSVYSNCDTVTLYHNGKSLGTKKRDSKLFPAQGLNWDISFEEGENLVKVEGKTKDSKSVKDSILIHYRFTKNEAATSFKLSSKRLPNGNYLVTATAVDDANIRCLDYEERVYFQCLSGGKTLKNQGTPTGTEAIKMANGQASIEVAADQSNMPIEMTVLNQNFKGEYLKINPIN